MKLSEREMATVDAALAAWEHRLSEGDRWIRSVYNFGGHKPLSRQEVQALRSQLKAGEPTPESQAKPAMWRISVPTYVGSQPHEDYIDWPDFAEPHVPVLVHEFEGVRIVMGSHDWQNRDKPDVQIERRPHGWAISIHPDAGDPVACLYILDDGRTCLLSEKYTKPNPEIVDDIPADVDSD